jgi:hypothetical protein
MHNKQNAERLNLRKPSLRVPMNIAGDILIDKGALDIGSCDPACWVDRTHRYVGSHLQKRLLIQISSCSS